MQQKLPCDVCSLPFREKAIVGYHAWFNGDNRTCFKQRSCLKCWRRLYLEHSKHFISLDDNDTAEPETCGSCGEGVVGDDDKTWSTWYRGQERKDTVVCYCSHCAAGLRTLMMNGAARQPDRELAGVGEGGAPLPNPQGFGSRDNLPW